MRDLVRNGPEMIAIFEDDARLAPELSEVLRALEERPFSFDVVSLCKDHSRHPLVSGVSLTCRHVAGRARGVVSGATGYVITREAAQHFLETTPKMILALDHALLRFWASGLNTFYIDPPVVYPGAIDDSQIEGGRRAAREIQHERDGAALVLWRRIVAGGRRAVKKRVAFRKLLRGEIGVTRWS